MGWGSTPHPIIRNKLGVRPPTYLAYYPHVQSFDPAAADTAYRPAHRMCHTPDLTQSVAHEGEAHAPPPTWLPFRSLITAAEYRRHRPLLHCHCAAQP